MTKQATYYKTKKIILTLIIVLLSVGFIYALNSNLKHNATKAIKTNSNNVVCQNCNEMFDDSVATHELAYEKEGIAPQETDEDVYNLFLDSQLVEIKTNEGYVVSDLQHSQPYILPKAKIFLDSLASRYLLRCTELSETYVPYTITSVTRSMQGVRRLMRGNGNAIENSAHLKGKTFDISYRAFRGKKINLRIFTLALNELKLEGFCYVKYERNGCLHITAI